MKKAIIALAALAISGAAVAGPKWTFAEADYVIGDSVEDFNGEDMLSGYNLKGSIGFANIWHVAGNYGSLSDAAGPGDDVDSYGIRGGVHPAVTDNTDMYAEIGYTQYEPDNTNEEPTEIDLAVGVRSNISDKLELRAGIVLAMGDLDFNNSDYTDVRVTLGGQYNFTEAMAVTVDTTTLGDGISGFGGQDLTNIGFRWSF